VRVVIRMVGLADPGIEREPLRRSDRKALAQNLEGARSNRA
jgi:hypothetical protein